MTLAVARLPRWTMEAEQGLGETLDGYAAEFARQVDAGIAELWKFGARTFAITRIEKCADHPPELVVCCLKGDRLPSVARVLIAAAKRQGLGGIRFHTRRAGLGRMTRAFGFSELERVYFLDLTGVSDG